MPDKDEEPTAADLAAAEATAAEYEGETHMLSTIALAIALVAIIYQAQIRSFVTTVGVFRIVQPISDFPYDCQRLTHPLLEGCEDIWFDDQTRHLYGACVSLEDRHVWAPYATVLNYTARKDGGHLVSLDVDKLSATKPDGGVKDALTKHLPSPGSGFDGNSLDLLGFAGQRSVNGRLQFHLINQRPKIDLASGKHVDGDYSPSVELFEESGSNTRKFKHVATYTDPLIVRPNRVVSDGVGGFYVSNDHSAPVTSPWWSEAEVILGGGFTVHCSGQKKPGSPCKKVAEGLWLPNGITRNPADGRIYVPSMLESQIYVYEVQADFDLKLIEQIQMEMPTDNLSPDRNGDIWAAGAPKIFSALVALNGELGKKEFPSTVNKITKKKTTTEKDESAYEWTKVIEDADMKTITGVTTAAFDAKKGWIFTGGVQIGWLSVCRPK